MSGHFEKGVYVEDQTVADTRPQQTVLADEMFTTSYAHFAEFQKTQPCGVVWRESTTGFLVVATHDPTYAAKLKQFIARLK